MGYLSASITSVGLLIMIVMGLCNAVWFGSIDSHENTDPRTVKAYRILWAVWLFFFGPFVLKFWLMAVLE